MPSLHAAIQLAGKTLPKVVSPKHHAAADYGAAALFLLGSAFFWRRNKAAATASLICGLAGASVAALTDYKGGAKHAIGFPLHAKIDLGLSSMAAAIPEILTPEDEKAKSFFRIQSLLIAIVAVLTEFELERTVADEERTEKRRTA
jgi:hypothetical protein